LIRVGPERAEVAWNGGERAEVAESPERAEVAGMASWRGVSSTQ